MTHYEDLLRTIPCFHGVDRRALRVIARLIDVVDVPAGGQLSRAKGEVIVAVQGHTSTNSDGTMLAVTPLRLFVFGRRELLSVFEALPDRVLRIVLDDTTASQSSGSVAFTEGGCRTDDEQHRSKAACPETDPDRSVDLGQRSLRPAPSCHARAPSGA